MGSFLKSTVRFFFSITADYSIMVDDEAASPVLFAMTSGLGYCSFTTNMLSLMGNSIEQVVIPRLPPII